MSALVYDPLDPAILADPYPVFAALRRERPVFWHEGMRCWALTRYADCVRVLRDHERFARDRRRTGGLVAQASLSVQSLDPPDQALVRSLFMNAVRAQDLDAIEQRAGIFLATRLDELAGVAEFDLMGEVAAPLALSVIADLLGVDEPDPGSFAGVSDAIMRSMDAGLDPALAEAGRCARQELNALVESWFHASAGRRGVLAHVRDHAGRALGGGLDVYVRNTARVMFQGGYSTMVAAIGNTVHTLLNHPEALPQLRDLALLGAGVEELVRYDGPVQGTTRIATGPVQIGEVSVRSGDSVLVLLAAANRDPQQFPHPDRLLPDRGQGRHLGYGWGTHACIGTVPAQMALRVLIRGLLESPAPLRAAGPGQRRPTATMRSFDRLPTTFRPPPIAR